jgi:uncharacterized protein (TIGR02118 family)
MADFDSVGHGSGMSDQGHQSSRGSRGSDHKLLVQVRRVNSEMAHGCDLQEAKDVEALNGIIFEKHVTLAKKLPGIRKYEVSYGPILSAAGPADAYMIVTLHFDDLAFFSDAVTSEACAADRRELAPDPSMLQMFLFDHKEV